MRFSVSPTADQGHEARQDAKLLDVQSVAELLGGCSTRHVYRLADSGRMPAVIKLGALVRWRRDDIDAWIADGCKPVRTVTPSRVVR